MDRLDDSNPRKRPINGDRYVLTLREARRFVAACEQYELEPDELVEIWRGETGALNAEGLLMRVQVSGADERFEVSE